MARRFPGLLAASIFSAVTLLATAACTSSGGTASGTSTTASPAQNAALDPQRLTPLFLECLAKHNVPIWDKAEGNVTVASVGKKLGWYENGHVVANNAFYDHADVIEGFYPISPDFTPKQTIATWVDDAVNNGTWPKVCGSLPSGG